MAVIMENYSASRAKPIPRDNPADCPADCGGNPEKQWIRTPCGLCMGRDHGDQFGIAVGERHHTSKDWALKPWHWPFMAQPYDLPERMMAGVPAQWFMERKLSKPGIGLGFFDPEAFSEYVRCFTWKTIRGSCEDYRACVTCGLEMDEADWRAGNKVTTPLLAVWGVKSHTGTVYDDVLAIWRSYATNVIGGPIDCGHCVPDEAPATTLEWLSGHFSNENRSTH